MPPDEVFIRSLESHLDWPVWDQKDLIEQLLKHYDKLDADIRADLPLKQIWTVAAFESESD